MDLKLVEYLLLAAETGSFAKAASKIGMGQPTFGRLIARLEQAGVLRLHVVRQGAKGGRSARRWQVNPAIND